MAGSSLEGYRMLALLGRGGMGEVHVAEQVALRRRVAVKLLRPELSADASLIQRFFHEAQAAARIRHPGIVEVYDFGTGTDGRAYLVMELLEGENLGRRIGAGPLPVPHAVEIARQVAVVMAAAHEHGVIHRDLKPDNIHLTVDSELPSGVRVKVLDFGLAKVVDQTDPGLTGAGAMMGTPSYISPEQCLSTGEVDHRTDVYALGCVLFAMLCGRPPFVASSTTALIGAHLAEPPPDPRALREEIPEPLAELVRATLAKRAVERPQQMTDVAAALAELARTLPPARIAVTAAAPVPLTGEAPPEVTTLSRSNGEASRSSPPAPRRRLGRVAFIAVPLALVLGVALKQARQPEAPARSARAVETGAASSPAPPRAAIVTLRSEPPGATVLRGGVLVGVTPCTDRLSDAGPARYVVHLEGYRDAELPITGGTDQVVSVQLERLDPSAAAPRSTAKRRGGGAAPSGDPLHNGILDPFRRP